MTVIVTAGAQDRGLRSTQRARLANSASKETLTRHRGAPPAAPGAGFHFFAGDPLRQGPPFLGVGLLAQCLAREKKEGMLLYELMNCEL